MTTDEKQALYLIIRELIVCTRTGPQLKTSIETNAHNEDRAGKSDLANELAKTFKEITGEYINPRWN